jgi:hypothetical protein
LSPNVAIKSEQDTLVARARKAHERAASALEQAEVLAEEDNRPWVNELMRGMLAASGASLAALEAAEQTAEALAFNTPDASAADDITSRHRSLALKLALDAAVKAAEEAGTAAEAMLVSLNARKMHGEE